MRNVEMRQNRKKLRQVVEEIFEHYGAKCIPLKDFEDYLMARHGLTRREAEDLWFETVKARIVSIEITTTKDLRAYNVIRLIEEGEDEYEVLG